MKSEFEYVRWEKRIKSIWFITLFVLLAIPQRVNAESERQWVPVAEANYADILELIAFSAKANYGEISSWQGRINILATDHHYGENVAAKLPMIDKSSLKGNTQHICGTAKTLAEFAVDIRNDKIYSNVEPTMQFRAVDLDQNVPFTKGVSVNNVRTILTPEIWIHYEPAYKYYPKWYEFLPKGRRPEKMAFIDAAQDVKGDIHDPRRFFNSGGEERKLWETLLQIRSDINERINVRVESYPHIGISSMETKSGIKYRILTTWKTGENSVIKYIRILLEVDEAARFNTIKVEATNPDGVKLTSKQYTYEDFNGIYVPKTIREELRNNKGEITGTSEITIENIRVNLPLPENTFSIKNLGVEEDTLVTDNIKKTEYRYSKGDLVPIADVNK